MPTPKTYRPRLDKLKAAELLERGSKDKRASAQTRMKARRTAVLLRKAAARKAQISN